MPRTDNDRWDLGSSVGATATMVAAAIDPHLLPRLAVIHPTQEDFR